MSRRILITGASVAGNALAWWLTRYGFDVTVLEKAPAFRCGGQNVDVRGAARDVLRRMGLEQSALDRNTGEKGTEWVDQNDQVLASFPVEKSNGEGFTAEMEILRGDMARLLYEPASQRTDYRFDDSIAKIEKAATGTTVVFASGRSELYDVVVVAEGVGSATRDIVFPGENRPRWMDITIAFFTIPLEPTDRPYARLYSTIGGRGATIRPGPDGKLHVYLGLQKREEGEHRWDTERQKQFLKDRFSNLGWQFPRILEGLSHTDDFYLDVLRQVRMDRWSTDAVVLLGDAAWCATPLSGIGTTLAIVGSYVLAGELAQTENHAAAFAAYERIMRPFVKEGQSVPKIVPRLLWPQSRFGLTVLHAVLRIASTPAIRRTFSTLFHRDSQKVALPNYTAPLVN